jgi:hypothetical protein
MNRGRWAVVPALFSLAACQSLAAGAKEQFSKDVSCPLDRIESRDRHDLHPSSFTNPMFLPKPSAEIVADPGRLAVWQRNHEHDRTRSDGDNQIEEVRGCGKQAFYECHVFRKSSRASCSQPSPPCTGCPLADDPRDPRTPVPAGITRW